MSHNNGMKDCVEYEWPLIIDFKRCINFKCSHAKHIKRVIKLFIFQQHPVLFVVFIKHACTNTWAVKYAGINYGAWVRWHNAASYKGDVMATKTSRSSPSEDHLPTPPIRKFHSNSSPNVFNKAQLGIMSFDGSERLHKAQLGIMSFDGSERLHKAQLGIMSFDGSERMHKAQQDDDELTYVLGYSYYSE